MCSLGGLESLPPGGDSHGTRQLRQGAPSSTLALPRMRWDRPAGMSVALLIPSSALPCVNADQELRDLIWDWSTAYAISTHQGTWLAARRDTGEMLTAGTAEELRGKIRADYHARPVPRDGI
jgi:hypothetical protein